LQNWEVLVPSNQSTVRGGCQFNVFLLLVVLTVQKLPRKLGNTIFLLVLIIIQFFEHILRITRRM